jgi:3-isopropylmalate dehydrogenase
MAPFVRLEGVAASLRNVNVDTDIVIPINRLIDNRRGELGRYCFEPIRYRADGSPDPAFTPGLPRYAGASILVAGENFGCGSSREAAVWALADYGLSCIIAPAFGDIFVANAFQNGMLPIALRAEEVDLLHAELEDGPSPPRMTVDLATCEITSPTGRIIGFAIDAERRQALLEGLDDIGMTLKALPAIAAFRAADEKDRPWIYGTDDGKPRRLLILAGDGIGAEIMRPVRRVAEWFRDRRGVKLELHEELFGIAAFDAHGSLMRDETWAEVMSADAILFGAIGSPDYARIPAAAKKVDQLLRMRRELDLFINLRPVRVTPGLESASTLRAEALAGTNMVIVRELAGGIYFGEPRGIEMLADGSRRAVNTCVYTDGEIRRIAAAAFELARTRQGRVCSVDKANVLEFGALWRETVQALRDEVYPDIELSHMYVDNCAMQLVRRPSQFDVIVTENLFGDILSDCAAMVAGSLGMLPSVSMGAPDPQGRRRALYEPIHGSAPDIAGQGVANPIGAILSFALCLRHTFMAPQEARRLEIAVERAIVTGARTADIASVGELSLSTDSMGDAVLLALEDGAPAG